MRIVFLGSTKFGFNCCEEVLKLGYEIPKIFTCAKKFKISYSSTDVKNYLHVDFNHFKEKYNIPVIEVSDGFSSKQYADEIKKLEPDLIVVIGWYYMVPKKIREIAKKGCIGIHPSLLPKYRGGAPLNWAIINGEKETGISLFHLEDGVDEGDIIAQRKITIEYEDNINTIRNKAENVSIEVLREILPLFEKNNAPRYKQDHSKATYVPQRSPKDGLIDWTKSSEEIRNFIRAQTRPYPGAFTYLNGKKVIIWDASILDEKDIDNKNND